MHDTRPDPPVFDGHNDALFRLWRDREKTDPVVSFAEDGTGHVDLPKARRGGFAGGLFALFSPSDMALPDLTHDGEGYNLPLPPPLEHGAALAPALEQAGIFLRLDQAGLVRACTTAAGIEDAMANGELAAVLHLEGADAIDPDFYLLDVLHGLGLRSLGPVWSRNNIFGHGTPFAFPSTPETGPGLTEAGRRLVRACNRRRILIDLSHMTEAGFDDVASITDAPLVASHSNAHALVPHARNLTDRQLDMIRDSDGLVGVNFATAFLRPDGQMSELETLDPVLRQLEYLLERLGESRVALGSDYDGALPPLPLADVGTLSALREAMRRAGFGPELMSRILYRNWIDLLRRTWGA